MKPALLTITGPTACGKTSLAVELAFRLNAEIISADSRQVFVGTHIPYHLIDIHDAGYEYNVYQFQNDFIKAYHQIELNRHSAILCGGTGLYVESVVKGYQLPDAPIDEAYRHSLENLSDEELTARLASYIKLHNHTDTETRERLIRALEIQEFAQLHPELHVCMPDLRHLIVGINYPREIVVERIGIRLRQRLQEGMVEEVQNLLNHGVPPERLLRYGLEYKHVTRYLQGECSYNDMYEHLYTDIRRFSKRQMTWFRRMERNGINIHWIDGQHSFEQKVSEVLSLYEAFNDPHSSI